MPLRFRETERGSGSSTTAGDGKIRCPKCAWQPGRDARWRQGPGKDPLPRYAIDR